MPQAAPRELRAPCLGDQALDQREVPRAAERGEHSSPGSRPVGGEAVEHVRASLGVGLAEPFDSRQELLDEDVEIARGARLACQPPELCAKPLRPPLVEPRPRGSEQGAHAPRRNPEVVQRLGAQPEANGGIGAQHRPDLRVEHRGEAPLGRRLRSDGRPRGGRQIEHAEHLRPLVPDHRPRAAQGLHKPAHVGLATGRQELDLDLVEPGLDSRLVLDRHDIVEDVRNGDVVAEYPPAQAARAKRGDEAERRAVQVCREQLQGLRRRVGPAARELDLEPAALGGQLQLPADAARTRPPAQRDPGGGEAVVGRVVVRRDERDRAQALTGQLREEEPLRDVQLALPLELVDGHSQSLRDRCGRGMGLYAANGMPSPGFEPGTPALGEPRSIP